MITAAAPARRKLCRLNEFKAFTVVSLYWK